ncbi:unnamed protein product, partial [Cylicostephanus goldi]
MRTVRSFACERREADRFEHKLGDTLRMNRKKWVRSIIWVWIAIAYMGYSWNTEFCDNAILVAVLYDDYRGPNQISSLPVATRRKFICKSSHNVFNAFTALIFAFSRAGMKQPNTLNIGYVMTGLMECVGASRKVFEYMLRDPEIANDGKREPPLEGQIKFENVYFTYPSRPNNIVLKGLDLTIRAGQTTALVGPSGGGKSSIVALIQHFYEPDKGTITIDGVNVKDISHMYYHHKVAMVAQEPVLYNGSVRYNI